MSQLTLIPDSGTTASGGAPSQLTSTYITHLLTTNALQHHIRTILQPAYTSRYNTLLHAISTYLLPLGFELPQPHREIVGGFFVWLALPKPLTADILARRCKDEGVIVAQGGVFEVPGDEEAARFDGHIRLCFAWEEEWKLDEGVRRIGEVVRRMLEEGKGGRGLLEEGEAGRGVEEDGGGQEGVGDVDAFK